MSYSCTIHFKEIAAIDVYPFFIKLKNVISDNLKNIAEDNYYFSPFFRRRFDRSVEFKNIPTEQIEVLECWALNKIFKYRYFYDADRGLLGVYNIPNCVKNIFDGSVYFQNSCDQDYNRSEYGGIKIFETIFDEIYNLDTNSFLKLYKDIFDEDFDKKHFGEYNNQEEYEQLVDYSKKTLIYQKIWNPISDTLYDESSVVYLSIYGPYDFEHLQRFIRHCHQKHLKG